MKHLEGHDMDLVTYGEARATFQSMVLAANYEGWAMEAKGKSLEEVQVIPFGLPDWASASNFRCSVRLLDLNRPIGERIVAGLRFPELDTLEKVTDLEYTVAMRAFLSAGGAVASALAIFGVQDTRKLDCGTGWKRVCPFSPWPLEALAALKDAMAEVSKFAPVWLSHMAQESRNTFAGRLYR